jgi:hypothetical protein
VNNELKRILEGSGSRLLLSYYSEIRLEGLRKAMQNLCKGSPSRNLNSGRPKYETGALTPPPRCSVEGQY